MAGRKIIPAAEVLLIGGGHSHVEVVGCYERLAIKPYRLTLVSDEPSHVYKGFRAALLADELNLSLAAVDLGHLCARADVRFVCDRAVAIDLYAKKVQFADSSYNLPYDILAIDPGAVIDHEPADELGLRARSLFVKPFITFVKQLETLEHELRRTSERKPFTLVIHGCDLRAFELAFALARRFAKNPYGRRPIQLVFVTPQPMRERYPRAACRNLRAALATYKIKLCDGWDRLVFHEGSGELEGQGGERVSCDTIVWTAPRRTSPFIVESGLALSNDGRVKVHPNLESMSHPGVYASGHAAFLASRSRQESHGLTYGQTLGRTLAQNITRRFTGLHQIKHGSTRGPAQLLGLPGSRALFMRDKIVLVSPWLHRYKATRDAQWLELYRVERSRHRASTYLESGNVSVKPCGGGAAQLPADAVGRLKRRPPPADGSVIAEAHGGRETSVVTISGNRLVQALDYQHAFMRNLFLFGQIATVHNTNHIFALGLTPGSAQMTATVPYGSKEAMARDLEDLYAGVVSCLDRCQTALLGGHYLAGSEASIAMLVQGTPKVISQTLWDTPRVAEGDALVLTKPLGSGIVFAGHERFTLSSDHLYKAAHMLVTSHFAMMADTETFPIHSAAHVGGYGLAYHIHRLLREPAGLYAAIQLGAIPIYDGVLKAVQEGIRTSLHTQNRLPFTASIHGLAKNELTVAEVLFDPQTAGPLLIALPAADAPRLLALLRERGYDDSAVIGHVHATDDPHHASYVLCP